MDRPTPTQRPACSLTAALIAAGAVGLSASPLLAQDEGPTDTRFTAESGNWSDAANWNNGEPAGDLPAFVVNGGTVTVDQAGETAQYVRIGDGENTDGNFVITGGDLTSNGNFAIADDDTTTGSYTQTGGTVAVVAGGGDFEIGDGGGGVGVFNMSGGTITTSDAFQLAPNGSVDATITGGEVVAQGGGGIGGTSNGAGVLTYSNASIELQGNWSIGNNGPATMTMNSGSISTGNDLEVADGDDADATFNLNGGTISIGDNYEVGQGGGIGVVNQTGGSVSAQPAPDMGVSNWSIGSDSSAQGIYNISGGSVDIQSQVFVGGSGRGELNQSGGDIIVGNDLLVASDQNSSGSYTISGGSLNTGGYLSVGGFFDSTGDNQITGNVGELTVDGSDATITVGTEFYADGQADPQLNFNVDTDGISTIDVLGTEFASQIEAATVDMGILSGSMVETDSTFDLIDAVAGFDGLPSLADADTEDWMIELVNATDGGQLLQATYTGETVVPEPASLALLSLGGLLLGARRRRR